MWILTLFLLLIASFGFAKQRHDIADVAWGGWFVAWFLTFGLPDSGLQKFLFGMICLWALRIATHIGTRFFKKSEMDARYKKMLATHGGLRTFAQVYVLQGLLAGIIMTPVLLFVSSSDVDSFGLIQLIGTFVFGFGLIFETLADLQLRNFLANRKSTEEVCNKGLWAWSRHPNYFGEVVVWWGVFIFTISGYESLIGLVGPITITFLILKVSGVPMLEKQMMDNPKYKDYIENTSVFWPRKPN